MKLIVRNISKIIFSLDSSYLQREMLPIKKDLLYPAPPTRDVIRCLIDKDQIHSFLNILQLSTINTCFFGRQMVLFNMRTSLFKG
jgi:hypothetical protein